MNARTETYTLYRQSFGWGEDVIKLEIVGDRWRLWVAEVDDRDGGTAEGRYIYPGTPGDFA